MVDLRTCKHGDKLRSCHGMILEYVGRIKRDEPHNPLYPHEVRYPNGARGTRTDDGQVFTVNRLPEDHDIVEIIPKRKTRNGAK
jgi:hypothetical protein